MSQVGLMFHKPFLKRSTSACTLFIVSGTISETVNCSELAQLLIEVACFPFSIIILVMGNLN